MRNKTLIFLLLILIGLLIPSLSNDVSYRMKMNLTSVNIYKAIIQNKILPWNSQSNQNIINDEKTQRWAIITSIQNGDYTSAKNILSAYRITAPESKIKLLGQWIYSKSFKLANNGDIDSAERIISLNLILLSKSEAYADMGRLFFSIGKMDQAEKYLLQSLKYGRYASTYFLLGEVYNTLGQEVIETNYNEGIRLLNSAVTSYNEAAKLDNNLYTSVNYHLGNVYWQLNRPTDAIQAYLNTSENKGSDHYAYLSFYYLGQIYSSWWNNHLDFNLAEVYFKRSKDLASNNFEKSMSLAGIGLCLKEKGQPGLARSYFSSALTLDPSNDFARENLNELSDKNH